MAESDINANPMATLEPTIPVQPDENETQFQELLLLGKDLERLLEEAKRDLEEIAVKVDTGEREIEPLRGFIYRLHQNRLAVSKKRDDIEKCSRTVLPDHYRIDIGHVEYATLKAVAGMEGMITDTLSERMQYPSATTHPQPVETSLADLAQPEEYSQETTYGARLAATKPSSEKSRTKSSKKESSRHTSSSVARKMKLLTEKAELEINSKFDKEQDARTRRLADRNAKKDSARREEEYARREEDEKRREEDIIIELDNKTIEREEAKKRQMALIDARLEVMESMEEGSSRRGTSVAPAVTEVSSEDKVAAYVGEADDPTSITVPTQLGVITGDLLGTHFPTEGAEHPYSMPIETNPTKVVTPSFIVKDAFSAENNNQGGIAKQNSLLDRFNQTLRDQNQYLEQNVPNSSFNLPFTNQIIHSVPNPIISAQNPVSPHSTQPIPTISRIPREMNAPIGLKGNSRSGLSQHIHPTQFIHSTKPTTEFPRIATKTESHNKGVEPLNMTNFEVPTHSGNELFSFDDRHMPLELSPRRPMTDNVRVKQHEFAPTVRLLPTTIGHTAFPAAQNAHALLPNNTRQPQTTASEQNRPRTTAHLGYSGDKLIFSTPDNRSVNTNVPEESRAGVTSDNSIHNETRHMLKVVCAQMALSRVPTGPPEVFDGKDPLSFPLWKVAFDALAGNPAMSATDKLNLLNRSLGGSARAAVKGFLLLPPDKAYDAAYRQLTKRYGNKVSLGNSFRDQLRAWPRISGTDNTGLRNYVDYLQQCRTAMLSYKNLKILDNESENADMMDKLPLWLSRKWARKVAAHREEYEEFPSFSDFVDFLDKEDRFAHDPITKGLSRGNNSKGQFRGGTFASEGHKSAEVGSNFGACIFCGERHSILICTKFKIKSLDFRMKFVRDKHLCFVCLNTGHLARDCRNHKPCEICQGRHPTVMHAYERGPANSPQQSSATTCASNDLSTQAIRKSSMVVPVYVSHTDNPNRHKMVFAMLDTQSDTSFITEKTARDLGLVGRDVRLSLSTMTSSDKIIKCKRFNGLQVRGFNSQVDIALPEVFSKQSIPINYDHIPCTEMLDDWPHLEKLRDHLVPKIDCEVGLLIGYNCPRALVTTEVISAPNNSDCPYGLKTELGWSIMGVITRSPVETPDQFGHSHRIAASIITGSQIPERRKEVASPSGSAAKDVYTHSTGHASPQDIPLINVSTSLCNRLFRIMIFTMATLLLIGHSATIIPKFVKYDTTTSVSTLNRQAEFPNTIICNTEPARETMVHPMGTQKLQQLTMNERELVPPDILQRRTGDSSPRAKDRTAPVTDEPGILRDIKPKGGRKRLKTRNK